MVQAFHMGEISFQMLMSFSAESPSARIGALTVDVTTSKVLAKRLLG
jgi:hypothetical protein